MFKLFAILSLIILVISSDQAHAKKVWAKHILVSSQNEAIWIVNELNNGAKFETLAQQYSLGPSGPNGGDLGWFTLGEMVPNFEGLVFSLSIGCWGSVETQFGWHVAKVYDRSPKTARNCKQYIPLASNASGINYFDDDIQVLKEAKINELIVRHVRMANYVMELECENGFFDHIELSGPINNDSTFLIEKLMDDVQECVTKDGEKINNFILLNSGGGLLSDGYALGRIIRKKQFDTLISHGGFCASSCAIAFMGGTGRLMGESSEIMFHSPYKLRQTKSGIAIDCENQQVANSLQEYYNEMFNSEDSDFLFKRTMSYCSTHDGWTLNPDAASIVGITNSY